MDVLVRAAVDDQPVCLPGKQIADQASHASLTDRFVVPAPRAGIDVDFYLQARHCVRKLAASGWILLLEAQLTLAGKEETAQRLAKLADM
jgi:hypothetical protein